MNSYSIWTNVCIGRFFFVARLFQQRRTFASDLIYRRYDVFVTSDSPHFGQKIRNIVHEFIEAQPHARKSRVGVQELLTGICVVRRLTRYGVIPAV